MYNEECTCLRQLLRLSDYRGVPEGKKNAGVLILLDGGPSEYRVFLTIRSEKLNRYPGDVCFPGGMMDSEDNSLQDTAIREAQEEVGLCTEDYFILGSLPAFRSRSGILIHPSIAVLRRPFVPHLNINEVSRTFWMPLELFLDNSVHSAFVLNNMYSVHSFSFDGAEVYGVTAFMCIIVAMMVLQRIPSFDINSLLTVSQMEKMALTDITDQIFQFVHLPFEESKL